MDEESDAEPEVVDEGASGEVKGFVCCIELFAVCDAVVAGSALGIWALDEGAEAFRSTNGCPEAFEVPDVDENAEEAGAGEDIMLLKMPEVAENELVVLPEAVCWEVDWVVTVFGSLTVAWLLLLFVAVAGIPTFEDSDDKPSVLAFFDPFSVSFN